MARPARLILAAVALLWAGGSAQAALMEDRFTALNTSAWDGTVVAVQSDPPTVFQGAPQVHDIQDGTVLHISSTMSDNQYRGYATHDTFLLSSATARARFKPMSGIDGLFELYLSQPSTGNYIGIGIYGGNLGADRRAVALVHTSEMGTGAIWSNSGVWSYGQWYQYELQVSPTAFHVALLNDSGGVIWSNGLEGLGIGEAAPLRLSIVQRMGNPSGSYGSETGIDWVTLMPEPATLGLLALGGLALLSRRRSA